MEIVDHARRLIFKIPFFLHFSVVIDNCIVGEKAVIKSGSVLKNCIIGPHFVVAAGTKKESVYLSNADGFMTID